jgi:hypothetical protein
MNARTVGFWLVTGFASFAMVASGIGDLVAAAPIVESVTTKLGYPLYFLPWLGAWKILGVVAVWAPDSLGSWVARVREWAYAGLVLTMAGAVYSHAMIGDFGGIAPVAVFTTLWVVSYVLRGPSRAAA